MTLDIYNLYVGAASLSPKLGRSSRGRQRRVPPLDAALAPSARQKSECGYESLSIGRPTGAYLCYIERQAGNGRHVVVLVQYEHT
jgi:hypothetical protein